MMKPMAILGAAVAVSLAVAPAAQASLVSRSMLIGACTSHDQRHMNDCAGYIAGIADMADAVQQGVCLPPGIRIEFIRKGVTDWLQAHTTSNGPAAQSVLQALRVLYRCGH